MATKSIAAIVALVLIAGCRRVEPLTEAGVRQFALRDAGIRPEALSSYEISIGRFSSLEELRRGFRFTRYLSNTKVPELEGRAFWYCMVQPKGQVRGGAVEYFIDANDGRLLKRLRNF